MAGRCRNDLYFVFGYWQSKRPSVNETTMGSYVPIVTHSSLTLLLVASCSIK